ncbi:tetratricopeptide repeat protein 17-like [Antedon mediterranea]|uniref:tetratricopeptide repeat protein 17-like n=1 Tax=Antedon mediterranea TaxID=105859 RepID=UPI003AF87B78
MWAGVILMLSISCSCEAVTHWFVTEKGMINNQIESVYNLRESYNVVTLLRQENLTKESDAIEMELIRQKKHIEDTEDKDHDLEKRFLLTDPDCVISEKPIEEFDLYTSTVLTLENKGIRPQDYILIKGKVKKFKKPNCTKIVDLPFSMYTYEHLQGMQTRSNVSGQPEKGLYSTLPDNDPLNKKLDKIGHYINKALTKNASSWVLYDMATFYWRIKGDALMAIECARRSLHFSSRKKKDIALLNLANVLHRGRHSADAVILTHAALGISKDVNGLYFTLANVYGALGELNSSLLFYEQTLQKQPDFEAAKKRIHAIYCQRKLEAALEAQHDSLQRTLSELREYQKLNDHFESIQEKIQAAQLTSEEQYEKNMNYHRHKLQHETHKCELREEKDNQYFVCKRNNMGAQTEMFGNPLFLKENEINATALNTVIPHCIYTDNEAVLCFNYTKYEKQFKKPPRIIAIAHQPTTEEEKQMYERLSKFQKMRRSKNNTSINGAKPNKDQEKLIPKSRGDASPPVEKSSSRSNTASGDASPPVEKSSSRSSAASGDASPPVERSSSRSSAASSRSVETKSSATTSADSLSLKQSELEEERLRILAKQEESDRILNDPGRYYSTSDDFLIVNNKRLTVMKRDDSAKFHAAHLAEQTDRHEKSVPKGWQHTDDGPCIQDEWTKDECKVYTTLPDWTTYSISHVHPEKKGIRMVELFNENLGIERDEVVAFPYYHPTCVQESKLDQGDTVMDYVECITQRGSMHNYNGQKSLIKEFLKYGLSRWITMEEMAERVRKAWHVTKSEDDHWMIYNHAGLFWRINGNFHQAIECFRRAVHYVPVESGDVPLVNVANLMLSIGKYNDANQLLRMALVVNKTEPLTYFLLGNVLAANGNWTLAAEQYRQALKIDENYEPAKLAFRHIYCYVSYFCKDCERIVPRWRKTLGRRKRSKCDILLSGRKEKSISDEDSIQSCNYAENSAIPSSCYADDPEVNIKGDGQRVKVCPCPDGVLKQTCCKSEIVQTSSLSSDNMVNSASHKNSSPYTQQHNDGKTNADRPDELLKTSHYIGVNTDGTEGMSVGLNVKNDDHTEIVKDKNGVPASVYGPKIPAPSFITDEFIKLIGQTQEPWPSLQECSSFKKSNLKAFTSTLLSIHAKEINIQEYIDFKATDPQGRFLLPNCRTDLTASLLTLDHLEGIARRAELKSSSERGLKEVLQNLGDAPMTKEQMGTKIAIALSKNRNNWIAANVASLYWRVVGNAKKAVDCSRIALFNSPPEHKDLALINLMNILHRAGYAQDAIIIGGIALESSPQLAVNYFTLANIHSSLDQFAEAIKYYEKTLQQQSDFKPAIDRLKTIKCAIINHQAGST